MSNFIALLYRIKGSAVFYRLIFALIVTFSISSVKFDLLETYLFDLNTRVSSNFGLFKLSTPKVAIIEITPTTLKYFNGYPSIEQHIKLLKKIAFVRNSTIIYNLRNLENNVLSFASKESSKNFVELSLQSDNIFFILNDMNIVGQGPRLETKLLPPYENLTIFSAPRTIDTKLNAKGNVTRRIILDYKDETLAPFYFAKKYNPHLSTTANVSGVFERIGTNQAYIRFHKNQSFPTISFEEVLSSPSILKTLEDKIILIGDNSDSSIEDYTDSPFALDAPELISTTELYANMLQTLIDNNAPRKAPSVVNIIITFIVSLVTIYIALAVKPAKGIAWLLITFFVFWATSIISLTYFNIWIGMAHPLLTIFLCYYFFIPYRLIIENRRSWEYLQKNKLLQQVEELKSNFISMMSHDLKTPIARIQGMTEVILKDNIPLSSNQREAVDTIKSSSDDLLRFINSILQYGRIESQGIELNKQSKDINKILQEIVKKHDFLAKVKRIKLTTDLEPMFPVAVDSELVRQVFSNLIENAIKYSPEESIVTIKSYESADKVIIEIQDQGVGIPPEEISNIFMKFYRSQNAKTSTIKGTGLGLYLAQYFIQLHKGEITVTSEVQKGSVFRVELPINS